MRVYYSNLKLPEFQNKMQGTEYGIFKANMATIMMSQRLDTFEMQASPDGPWEPTKNVDQKLIDARADYREEMKQIKAGKRKSLSKKAKKMRDGNKILQDTGRLRASFSGSGTGISIYENDIMIFTNVEYAARANWGWEGEQPARRYDLFTEEQEQELLQFTEKYLYG